MGKVLLPGTPSGTILATLLVCEHLFLGISPGDHFRASLVVCEHVSLGTPLKSILGPSRVCDHVFLEIFPGDHFGHLLVCEYFSLFCTLCGEFVGSFCALILRTYLWA